jgi:hypothetical protein
MVSVNRCTIMLVIYLVLGSFQSQATENVNALLQCRKCDLVIISGGLICMLQPPDIVINQPFKVHIQSSYSEWVQKT